MNQQPPGSFRCAVALYSLSKTCTRLIVSRCVVFLHKFSRGVLQGDEDVVQGPNHLIEPLRYMLRLLYLRSVMPYNRIVWTISAEISAVGSGSSTVVSSKTPRLLPFAFTSALGLCCFTLLRGGMHKTLWLISANASLDRKTHKHVLCHLGIYYHWPFLWL